jgi:hypothetical protein
VAIGMASDLKANGKLRLSRALVNGQNLDQVDIAHSTRIAEQIAGTARLSMERADFGLGIASGAFRVDGQSVTLNRLKLDLLGVKAAGRLSLPAGARLPNGEVAFTVASLQPIGRLSGQQLSGQGRGSAQFAARAGGESKVQTEFDSVRINSMALQRLRVDGKASALGAAVPNFVLRIDGEDFAAADGTRVDTVSLTADGSLAALRVDGTLSGTHGEQPLSTILSAFAALDKPTKTVQFDAFQASYGGEVMRLLQPARLRLAAQSIELEGLDLALPDE